MRRILIRENAQNAAPLPPNYYLKGGRRLRAATDTFQWPNTAVRITGGRGRVKVQAGKSGTNDGLENKNKTLDEMIVHMSCVGEDAMN